MNKPELKTELYALQKKNYSLDKIYTGFDDYTSLA